MNKYGNMRFLLHVSDFHIQNDPPKKAVSKTDGNKQLSISAATTLSALKAVSDKLFSQNIQVDYLVHTGDIIHSSDIKNAADPTAVRSERFDLAEMVMKDIMSEFNIPAGNVIICCGNHDVIRDPGPKNAECPLKTNNKDHWQEVSFLSDKSISDFNAFLGRLRVANAPKSPRLINLNDQNTSISQDSCCAFCTLGNLNVLILNTNWTNPDGTSSKYQNCIKCSRVCKKIDSILNSPKYKRDNLNIVVAHKPLYEICENARLTYKNYSKTPFMSMLHNYLGDNGIYLCGDKHTRSIIGASFHDVPHYLSGEPLYESNKEKIYEAEYNLLGIVDGKVKVEWKIHLWRKNKGKWNCDIRPQDATVSELYELSRGYISPLSFKYLSADNRKNTWESLCQILYRDDVIIDYTDPNNALLSECAITTDHSMDKMFKSMAYLRESGKHDYKWLDSSTDNLDRIRKNIFVVVTERIVSKMSEKGKNILNLRGPHSTGKSSFLGILYIYLLRLYSMGKIDFIPAYFALENRTMLKKVQNSTTYYQAVKEEFSAFAKEIQRIAHREGTKVCYILDRIDSQDYWSLSSEASVGRGLLDILAKCENACHIISYGDYGLPWFKRTMPPRTYNDHSDVLYFNPIEIYKIATRESEIPTLKPEFVEFVRAFLEKYGFFENVLRKYPLELKKKITLTSSYLPNEIIDDLVTQVCELITKFRRLEISPGFIRQNYGFLTELRTEGDHLILHDGRFPRLKNVNLSIQQVHNYYIDRQLDRALKRMGYDFVNYAPAMAYLFSRRRYTYEKFIKIKETPALCNAHPTDMIAVNQDNIYNAFMFIAKHEDACDYLVALHYHRELRYYTEHPEEAVPSGSILNDFINRPIAVMIRKNCKDTNKFIIICDALLLRNDLKSCCYSMLLYCLSHIQIYEPIRRKLKDRLFNKAFVLLEKEMPGNPKISHDQLEYSKPPSYIFDKLWAITSNNPKLRLEHFLSLSLLHTMMLNNAIEKQNSDDLVELLKENVNFRIYNRQHQLLYYQDVSINGEYSRPPLNVGTDTIHRGMDFGNTMNYLCEKICSTLFSSENKYPLFQYDLYTLCDLILSRYPSDHTNADVPDGKPYFSTESHGIHVLQITNYLTLILKKALRKNADVANDEGVESSKSEENVKKALEELHHLASLIAQKQEKTDSEVPEC